MKSAFKQE